MARFSMEHVGALGVRRRLGRAPLVRACAAGWGVRCLLGRALPVGVCAAG